MALFTPSEPPASKLGHLRQLSSRAGVHVSPFQLGGMSIGESPWAQVGMGNMTKESSFKLLDTFWDQGGNFIDTAGNYQDGTSEKFIGEWAEARGIRDHLVIATKVGNIRQSLARAQVSDRLCPVFLMPMARASLRQTGGAHGEQCQEPEELGRSQSQGPSHDVYRYLVRSLVGLGHVHLRDNGRSSCLC